MTEQLSLTGKFSFELRLNKVINKFCNETGWLILDKYFVTKDYKFVA